MYLVHMTCVACCRADKVKAEVLKTKVEISLLKAAPNVSWRSLEKGAAGPAAAGVAAAAAPEQQQGPPRAYPSSKPTRDWGKVEGTAALCTACMRYLCCCGMPCFAWIMLLHVGWLSRLLCSGSAAA
jgi:hypothetical protein